jgi:hypothetical protein
MSKEKEELIIKLLKEGETQKQILVEARTSPNQVTAIRRRLEGDTDEPSIRNQAYIMFKEGRKPIDVAIALQIDNAEAIRYWKEYLELTREYDLLRIRNELKKTGYGLSQLVNLYRHMKKKKYNIDNLKRALEVVSNLDSELFNLSFTEAQGERAREEVEQLKKVTS